jgi:hypothetical protein
MYVCMYVCMNEYMYIILNLLDMRVCIYMYLNVCSAFEEFSPVGAA